MREKSIIAMWGYIKAGHLCIYSCCKFEEVLQQKMAFISAGNSPLMTWGFATKKAFSWIYKFCKFIFQLDLLRAGSVKRWFNTILLIEKNKNTMHFASLSNLKYIINLKKNTHENRSNFWSCPYVCSNSLKNNPKIYL